MSLVESPVQVTLFVDDAEGLLRKVQTTLRKQGYEHTAVASSVEAARRILQTDDIGHVVCDWKMPDEDGIQFLSWVHADYPDCRLSLLTGHAEDLGPEDLDRLQDLGVQVFDKGEIDIAWLIQLVAPDHHYSVSEENVMDSTIPDRGEKPDIGELRLENEELRLAYRRQRKMISRMAEDIIEDLRQIKDPSLTIHRGSKTFTVEDIIREIENETPDGDRFIELDRAVRRRLLFARVK